MKSYFAWPNYRIADADSYVTWTRLGGSDTGVDPSVGSSKFIKKYIKCSVEQPHPYPHPHPCRVGHEYPPKVKGPCIIAFHWESL